MMMNTSHEVCLRVVFLNAWVVREVATDYIFVWLKLLQKTTKNINMLRCKRGSCQEDEAKVSRSKPRKTCCVRCAIG